MDLNHNYIYDGNNEALAYFSSHPVSKWNFYDFKSFFSSNKTRKTNEKSLKIMYRQALINIMDSPNISKNVKDYIDFILKKGKEKENLTNTQCNFGNGNIFFQNSNKTHAEECFRQQQQQQPQEQEQISEDDLELQLRKDLKDDLQEENLDNDYKSDSYPDSFRKAIFKYMYCLVNNKPVESIDTITASLLDELPESDTTVLDRFSLALLDDWKSIKTIDSEQGQLLRLCLSRIINMSNKKNPILKKIDQQRLDSYDHFRSLPLFNMQDNVMEFINNMMKLLKTQKNQKKILVWITEQKLQALRDEDNDEFIRVIEIFDYIITNINIFKSYDKKSSELHYFNPLYTILNILFRDTGINLIIGENCSISSKHAKTIAEKYNLNLKTEQIRGRKIDMILKYMNMELCALEWKSISTTTTTQIKQQTKNLRVNKCILSDLTLLLDDDTGEIFCMEWIEIEDFGETIKALLYIKNFYVNISYKIHSKCTRIGRKRLIDSEYQCSSAPPSRSPSPHTFFSPKRG
ncbi:hypothetical protein BJ944DRAFT_228907 [Cunninghamella echinulata]|nr:hypothetical protein BJ944DRAFT_228907 [Cunninghamella echinulata]